MQRYIKMQNVKRNLTVFFVLVVFVVACTTACFTKNFIWVRTDGSGDYISGTYYGLGITNEENLWGKIILSISEPLCHHCHELSLESGTIQLLLNNKQIGKNRNRNCTFVWYDNEMRIRAQGVCTIAYNEGFIPFINSYTSFEVLSIISGTYYKADGSIGSVVKDGDGNETFWDMQEPIVDNKIIGGIRVQ
jgi:hypothetical protein